MDTLKKNELKELAEIEGEWCVSLYMPTHRAGRETQQDPIRLRNLISQAQEMLIEYGVRRPDVEELMRPVEGLLTDTNFWQYQGDGLAAFLSPGYSRTFRLPFRFDEVMVIGRRFHIKPLLPVINEDGQFRVLAISLNGVRLFLGTRDEMMEVDLSGMPAGMDEILHMDDPEKHLDFRTGSSGSAGSGDGTAIYHGHGTQSDEENKKNILRYFHYLDKELADVIEEKDIPMVLAGVEYLLPIYREANTYPRLTNEAVVGSPEGMDEREIHRRAWELVLPIFEAGKKDALKRFERMRGQKEELITGMLETAVKAAMHGRVDTLFIPLGVQRWGRFVSEEDRVVMENDSSPENEDLFDLAARQTLLSSGQVFVVQPDELPGEGELAAILRFAV